MIDRQCFNYPSIKVSNSKLSYHPWQQWLLYWDTSHRPQTPCRERPRRHQTLYSPHHRCRLPPRRRRRRRSAVISAAVVDRRLRRGCRQRPRAGTVDVSDVRVRRRHPAPLQPLPSPWRRYPGNGGSGSSVRRCQAQTGRGQSINTSANRRWGWNWLTSEGGVSGYEMDIRGLLGL